MLQHYYVFLMLRLPARISKTDLWSRLARIEFGEVARRRISDDADKLDTVNCYCRCLKYNFRSMEMLTIVIGVSEMHPGLSTN